jgi:hypothetical protein
VMMMMMMMMVESDNAEKRSASTTSRAITARMGYLVDCARIDAHASPFAHGALQEETCARGEGCC